MEVMTSSDESYGSEDSETDGEIDVKSFEFIILNSMKKSFNLLIVIKLK